MAKEQIWNFLATLNHPGQNTNLNELEKDFEVEIMACKADGDVETIYLAHNRLQEFVFKESNRDKSIVRFNALINGAEKTYTEEINRQKALSIAKEACDWVQDFISDFIEKDDTVASQAESEISDAGVQVESTQEDCIIKGVKGLAHFLGCGTTKAQAIINSKILEKNGIQWNAGGWRFDAEKLQEFRDNNPGVFERFKCPH